jgi:hypothetical protein
VDDLELLTGFRSHVDAPSAERSELAHARLMAEIDRPGGPRRPLRRPAALALIAAPATAAIVVLALAGSLGGSGTIGTSLADAAIIHRADAALSPPPNEILHTRLVGDGFFAESWQLTSSPYSFVGIKGPLGRQQPEQADNGVASSYFDPRTNTIYEAPDRQPQTWGDPIATVREELHTGRAQMVGRATTDGIPTYEIRFATKNGFGPDSVIAYVDQRTYRPVLLSDPQRDGTIVQLQVVAFEYLPTTRANLRLLSLPARHPGARVVELQSSKPAFAK